MSFNEFFTFYTSRVLRVAFLPASNPIVKSMKTNKRRSDVHEKVSDADHKFSNIISLPAREN
jgi:hypothetical protein